MTGLVRGLLAAPVAALVGWLASLGVHVSSDLVVSIITAVVGALAMAVLHLAERRWPALARAVAWLGREVPAGAQTGSPAVTGPAIPAVRVGPQSPSVPPTSGPAGTSNVRPADTPTTGDPTS